MSYSSKTKSGSVILFIQSFLLDLFFGGYLASITDRIIYPHFFSDETVIAPTTSTFILYGIFAFTFAAFCSAFGFSLSAKILGKPIAGWRNSVTQNIGWIIGTFTIAVGWIVSKVSPVDLFSAQSLGAAKRLFGDLLTPNLEIFSVALFAMIDTIYIAFMATIIALPFSFILSFGSARNLMKNNKFTFIIYNFLRFITNFTRSIEPLIWAIIFSVWVGIGPFAGMLALMLHSVASLTKQYSEIIESVDNGPIEGISATGANRTQVIWFGIVPQIVLPYISFTIYRWDTNVRMATIIGLVGGGGIGTLFIQYQGQALWHEVGTLALLIVIVVWSLDTASAYIREALR